MGLLWIVTNKFVDVLEQNVPVTSVINISNYKCHNHRHIPTCSHIFIFSYGMAKDKPILCNDFTEYRFVLLMN